MGVAPGTVVSRCGEDNNRCDVTLVLDWRSANPALSTGVQGATTVSLALTKQGGQMKIAREKGVPLLRSSDRAANSRPPIGARSPIGNARQSAAGSQQKRKTPVRLFSVSSSSRLTGTQ